MGGGVIRGWSFTFDGLFVVVDGVVDDVGLVDVQVTRRGRRERLLRRFAVEPAKIQRFDQHRRRILLHMSLSAIFVFFKRIHSTVNYNSIAW